MQTRAGDLASALEDGRRLDLDWVRIGAFGLLILFHVGMFYVPWDWHVKSPRVQPWLIFPMTLLHPWRLTLLFLVSGAATRFMVAKLSPGSLAWRRTGRLLPPLLLGMAVIVPPQSYMQVVEGVGYRGSFADFYRLYATGYHGFCKGGECLTLPTWNHLWFVAYLLVYTLVLALWLKLAPGSLARLQAGLERALRGWGLLVWPTLVCIALRMTLAPLFPETHALVGDWSVHAVSFAAMLFGFLLARSRTVWDGFERLRWPALMLALVSYAAFAPYAYVYDQVRAPEALRVAMRAVYGVDQWSFIAAVLGFARRWLAGRDGPVRRYLTEAIFPFYIVHQTVIVLAAPALARAELPLPVEAAALIALTAAACFTTFEIVRRVGWLRPLFGLKARERRAPPEALGTAATRA